MENNLLSPLEFTEADVQKYVRDYRCGICGLMLMPEIIDRFNRIYNVKCIEHGVIIEGGAVHCSKYQKIEQDITEYEWKIRKPLDKTPQELLSELGY